MSDGVDLPSAGRSTTGPVRTCVGCRSRAAASDLLRVVAVDGSLIPDPRGRLPGRGAHLHPTPECLTLAERRAAFPRALRVPGPLDGSALRAWITPESVPPASPAPHRPHDRESRDEHPMNTQP